MAIPLPSSNHALPDPTSGPVSGVEELDPELLALPDPPKGSRSRAVGLLVAAAVASLAMSVSLRHDVGYALSDAAAPLDVRLEEGLPAGAIPNRLATATGAVGVAGSVRYERPFRRGSFRVLPVVGRNDLYVEVAVPERSENGRFVPPDRFRGRLVPIVAAGPRFRGLAGAAGIGENAWIIVDGETPASARWSLPLAIGLVLAAGFFTVAALRLVRPVPPTA